MKKKVWIPIVIAVAVLLILFVPIPTGKLKDGGTRIYSALTYKIVDWNRDYGDGIYDETRVYFGTNAWKSTDELWAIEEQNLDYHLLATIIGIQDTSVRLKPLNGEEELQSAQQIEIDVKKLSNINVTSGDLVDVTYTGEIMESSPARINAIAWKKIKPQYDRNFEGTWMNKNENQKQEKFSPGTIMITQIYADCFFAQPTSSTVSYSIKLNGKLTEDWCIGDEVKCTYENVYYDSAKNRVEADCTSISPALRLVVDKPVIYLYPEEETEISVKLTVDGELTCTYPAYEDGWTVTAAPDGTLTDQNGMVYNYLYWEALSPTEFDFSQGFCVKGEDTAAFLEEALAELGLNRREANEFIVYWLPLMQNNGYNVISFQGDVYTDSARLEINPNPDTLIRVFMAWYGSDVSVEIPQQELNAPERVGFTVVEWGGTQVGA